MYKIGNDHVLLSLMMTNIFSKTNFTHHTIPKRSIGNAKVWYVLRLETYSIYPIPYPNLGIKLNKLYCLSKNIFHGKITLVYTLDS